MRKNIKILILFMIILSISGYKFPDNIPDWQNLRNFKLDKFSFGKTTANDFAKLVPEAVPEQAEKGNLIFTAESPDESLYKRVRLGFRNNKLDWVEFALNSSIKMSQIIQIYGKPESINTKYSNILDYYNYGFFNISTDKNHEFAKSINIFETFLLKNKTAANTASLSGVPFWQNLNKSDFPDLKPGITLETDFNDKYPGIIRYKKDKNSNTSIYMFNMKTGIYKNIIISFNNGLLSWINLTPQKLPLANALKAYGAGYKIEHINKNYDFYDYKNFILVIDKTEKKVVSIGILACNSK